MTVAWVCAQPILKPSPALVKARCSLLDREESLSGVAVHGRMAIAG